MPATPDAAASVRLDAALVGRGLARSRGEASELIRAGSVLVDGVPAAKASLRVAERQALDVRRDDARRVGRAGRKLDAAFRAFAGAGRWEDPLTAEAKRCLDVGASTGGFTQVLLERGASHVTALDVGHGQLVAELAADPRVRDLPGCNIRDVVPADLGDPFDLVVADVSFISLRHVLPPVARLLAPGGQAVVLVKPQFEVGRERLGKNGVVREPAHQRAAIVDVATCARGLGLAPVAVEPTDVPGSGGNREYLMWLTTRTRFALPDDEKAADEAVRRFEGER